MAVLSKRVVEGALRDWPDEKASRVVGLSSPHYEWRFRAPERLFSRGTSRRANYDYEHAMWK
jgi:hypothetical protein